MQHFAAFGGEKKVIERRPSAEPKGTVAGGGFGGLEEASAEPKLTEKEEDLRQNRRERWLEGGFGRTEAY